MSKEIVVPGELLTTENKQIGVHTFARDGKIFADCLGIRNESNDRISVVPLRGKYVPVENDVIIGVVKNEKFAGYDIEINSFYPSFVSNKDMREPLKVGSVISAKIVKVTEMNEAELGMVRSLNDGEVVSVTPVKVPRIIGKNASMLNAVKNGTGSSIMVGRNGLVWIHGGNTPVAAETILRIEEYSHAENLTHDIQCFLAARTGTGMPNTQGPSNEDAFETGMNSHYGGRGFRDGGSRGGFGRGRGNFNRGPRSGGFAPRDNRMRGGFDRGFNRMNNRPRGNDRFGNRGFENDAFSSEDRGFGRGNDRTMRERRDDRGERGERGERDFGERSTSFRPRNNFNRGFGERNRDEGFQMNKRFGRQYDDPQVGGESFNRNQDSFDKRKRFPRDNRDTRNTRVRGDEDPMFE